MPFKSKEDEMKGGRAPEQFMDVLARNREELGLPATEGGAGVLMDHLPLIGLLKALSDRDDMKKRTENPEYLRNTVGKELGTNLTREAPADVQMMSEGGIAGVDGLFSNPNPRQENIGKMSTAGAADEDGPVEIPEDIKEYVEKMHKEQRESRPDENWRIAPAQKKGAVAPYLKNEEEADDRQPMRLPQYAEGGIVSPFDVDGGDSDTMKMDGQGVVLPPPAPVQPPPPVAAMPGPASSPATSPAMPPESAAPKPPIPSGPALTDQDFMDRANKMLGLNPQEQAGFMKLLGGNAQKAQLGSALAGIGDAIAAGGTLGKVIPGALNKSEELIQGRTNQGIEGLQNIRENQGKAQELSDKLEARDPKSPLSQWAQKAYAGVGKKVGLDLSNASAALIADVTGKGVDALRTDYEAELKKMGLDLQKQQVAATITNQKAERDIAREGHQAEAAKTLADRGIFKTLANSVPGTAGHAATKVLEKQATGQPIAEGPVKVNSMEEYKALPSGTHYVDSYGTEKVKK